MAAQEAIFQARHRRAPVSWELDDLRGPVLMVNVRHMPLPGEPVISLPPAVAFIDTGADRSCIELEFVTDGEALRAPAGTLVVAPRGQVHAFPVAVGGPARFLNVHTPGGFERYMRTLMQMRARGEEPDAKLQREHDQYPV